MSFTMGGIPEAPRVVEALANYWQQIGLNPKITATDQTTFRKDRTYLKNVGQIGAQTNGPGPDMLEKAALYLMPNSQASIFMDEGSYAIYKEGNVKVDAGERGVYAEKLNQYYFENYGPIPVVKLSYCYAWNPDKIAPFPHTGGVPVPYYLEYVRHAQPLNTFRLFTPWEGR
jgi:ABC-type transport system substrate-binding protein